MCSLTADSLMAVNLVVVTRHNILGDAEDLGYISAFLTSSALQ